MRVDTCPICARRGVSESKNRSGGTRGHDVALDLGIDGRYAVADKDSGETVVNTGGTVLSVAPGVYLNAAGGAWLFVRAEVPFYKRFMGEQDQLPSVVTGLQYQVL